MVKWGPNSKLGNSWMCLTSVVVYDDMLTNLNGEYKCNPFTSEKQLFSVFHIRLCFNQASEFELKFLFLL